MADINNIAKQFVDYFYSTFDSDRKQLSNLYRAHSMLTWEASQIQGAGPIVEKLTNLPFSKVQHHVSSLNAQPSSETQQSIIVLVTGQLMVDDSPNPLQFSEAFQLVPEGNSYFIFNDVFSLVYG